MPHNRFMKIGASQLPDTVALQLIMEIAPEANERDLDIVCLPECFLRGYTRDEATAKRRALDLSSSQFETILQQIKDCKATIILGLIEVEDGKLFNTTVVIRQGQLAGKYRKTHPNERIFVPGSGFPVFTVRGFKFGINICNDVNYPEASAALATGGAQAIFFPLNNRLASDVAERWRHRHLPNLIARAKETGCWTISSDVVMQSESETGYGCTAIVDSHGRTVARVPELQSGMVTTEIYTGSPTSQ